MKWPFIKNALPEDIKKSDKSPENYTSEQQKFRQFEDLKELEDAISEAENKTNPQRYQLNRIYDEIEQDPHFVSQWESRKMKTLQREFGLYTEGSEDKDDATSILESDWFFECMSLVLDSKKRGFELLTFGDWDGNKFKWSKGKDGFIHKPIRNFNYDHVLPEKGLLKRNNYDHTGLDLFSPPISSKTLFVGDPYYFGILKKCAKYILIKNNCLLNWSEFAEVFGHDLRIGKTESQGDSRKNFVKMLKNLGSGGFGVMDIDDSIEFAGTSRTDAYRVYLELNEYVDKNISKIVFGQDVVSDMTGKTRGTAAENITNMYGDHDAKFLKGIVNDELIPKLISMGVKGLEGKAFDWVVDNNVSVQDQADIDLKIYQMGKTIDEEYLTEKYGTVLGETPEPLISSPEKVANQLKKLYGSK
jgi:phage gp29-like protein